MDTKETTFENAKVGDRVFSTKGPYGKETKTNGYINSIDTKNAYSINVIFDKYEKSCSFTLEGLYEHREGPSLFWTNPIKEIPVRPKRKVTKMGWMGILDTEKEDARFMAITTNIYKTKEEVERLYPDYNIKQITYETEE